MLGRIWKYVSNNPLAATIVGTITGGWILTQLVAMKASDVGGVLGEVSSWLRAPSGSTRAEIISLVVVSVLLGFVGFAAILLGQYQKLRRKKPELRSEPQIPVRFAPETFELTPPRARALLTLIQRVDARTTLNELHRFTSASATYTTDRPITKGQLQHDMEDAERAGIVSIDRVGTLTHYYNLSIPEGRDWVLRKEAELKAEARKGMARRDLRSP